MLDSYDDGWSNGSSLSIQVGSTSLGPYHLDSGSLSTVAFNSSSSSFSWATNGVTLFIVVVIILIIIININVIVIYNNCMQKKQLSTKSPKMKKSLPQPVVMPSKENVVVVNQSYPRVVQPVRI